MAFPVVVLPLHGIGWRADLPAPGWLVTYAAATVVLLTFFALGALPRRSRFETTTPGVQLPVASAYVARGLRALAKALVLGAFVIFLVAAWLGVDDRGEQNPAPTWFYVWFWVGLVPASVLLGPFWASVNPLRTVASGLRALLRIRPLPLPEAVGHWPAVGGLAAFLWLELVHDDAGSPRVVAAFVTTYAVLHVVAGLVFGSRWFVTCEAFEVYAGMVAHASPVFRGPDGRVGIRNPFRNLAATPRVPDLTPVVVLVLGSTGFDGLSRTTWWSGLVAGTSRAGYLVMGTVGLFGCVAVVAASYGAAVVSMRPFMSARIGSLSGEFAHALVPVAIGYTVAHYFSFAIFQGQQGVILGTDPVQRGWDLFGLGDAAVDYTLVSATTIAFVQVAAIVVGHVVAVLAAHDRTVALARPGDVLRAQSAMVAVMVLYTCVGIGLVAA